MGNYHPILMKFDTQTKKNMLSSTVTKEGMIDRFQDGLRHPVGNSSACYKMGNYHPIAMKIGTQAKKNILSSKVTKAKVTDRFKMAAGAMLELLRYEMGNYHRTLMKIGTQTKQNMLIECKSHKSGSLRQKNSIFKCKKAISF
jgi:hypothetical protein